MKNSNYIYQARHESHFKYLFRLYWFGYKDYFFGFISGILFTLLFFYG